MAVSASALVTKPSRLASTRAKCFAIFACTSARVWTFSARCNWAPGRSNLGQRRNCEREHRAADQQLLHSNVSQMDLALN